MIEQSRLINQALNSRKLELLQRRIHEEDYLHAAIQRLALVLSKELMEINASGMREGGRHERQRKRRK